MLNTLMHEIVDIGMATSLTAAQRERLLKKLWHLCWEYDCNWGEIIDAKLAKSLSVCVSCGKLDTELDEHGYCVSHQMEYRELTP